MPATATTLPPARSWFFRYIINSNPFYLLSACFMLAGCLALTNSLSWWSIPTSRLLILFATLNVYEAALIGLAAYLILGRGIRRDGVMLIMLEAFFLIDITFLNAEISTHHSWLGPALAVFSFFAGALKLFAIMHILGIRRSPAQFAFVMVQIGMILAIPLVFSRNATGSVSPRTFYIAWWIVGLMPVVYECLKKWLQSSEPQVAPTSMMVAYMVLPWLSLAAHLGILHYVYDVPFFGAMAAPAILALAMTLGHGVPEGVMPRKDILTLRILLPLAAIFVSASSPSELTLLFGRHGNLAIPTLHLAIGMAYLQLMYSFLRRYWISTTLIGASVALAHTFGPTTDQMINSTESFWNQLTAFVWNHVPTTQTSLGALFVVLAFVFLGIGAVVSLRRPMDHLSDRAIEMPE